MFSVMLHAAVNVVLLCKCRASLEISAFHIEGATLLKERLNKLSQ